MARIPLPEPTRTSRIVAVLRARRGEHVVSAAETLAENGVVSVEVTLGTPGALEAVETLRERLPRGCDVGVGTVLTRDDALRAADVGVDYAITPTVVPEVVETFRDAGVPVIPGALTPTEISLAWELGASAVKVFPASLVGVSYVGQLQGPLPHVALIPSGGVAIADARSWLDAGCVAVSLGGPLLGDALDGGDLEALGARARTLVSAVSTAAAYEERIRA
ncbi:bifunctional 4-hydroxy-2-oxoglutarate aldolase/2-dehydro-3-deoxy-phosphogluconate aldolase [Mumia zhuanghuii]|uniref:Bifunctional 4-hydroxy-2-oxoglutarate aldolase/2-dehydro-3-deoxy-phosphogluconate aldolase n=2 Tax=Mumia TaxID=1546255 RepID=A0ABW1QRJ5_9ACTN|nr:MULTISPECIES: bifunctional 4-hydroxy-2-oxoglutarate aldolase/2-dehydro-3-deoxy-phosphogluconate aldolase [Mumia]KAA1420467.1 bifunctional 4-hydroxy-2-oxoglutarate aldolase/2-dehydro-3-deoxy-phosphogluconate aldolase [Mumia zhuanghuii]